MTYKFGHIEPWWDDSFKTLDYTYAPIKNTYDEERWINEGYKNITLNGALYNMSNIARKGSVQFSNFIIYAYL